MTAPVLDETKPLYEDPVDESLESMRNNATWLVAMCAINAVSIPPWDATPYGSDLTKPDYVELVHAIDGRKVKATFTYTGDKVTQIVLAFDDTGGYANFAYGTATITYDGNGNWTGTTWA